MFNTIIFLKQFLLFKIWGTLAFNVENAQLSCTWPYPWFLPWLLWQPSSPPGNTTGSHPVSPLCTKQDAAATATWLLRSEWKALPFHLALSLQWATSGPGNQASRPVQSLPLQPFQQSYKNLILVSNSSPLEARSVFCFLESGIRFSFLT